MMQKVLAKPLLFSLIICLLSLLPQFYNISPYQSWDSRKIAWAGQDKLIKNQERITVLRKNIAAIKRLNSLSKSSKFSSFNKDRIVIGTASFYSHSFHGKQTASGIIYDSNALTAASNELNIPSVVKVTNIKNNKSIHVLVNDRGPVHPNRIIDLSRRAAAELGFIHHGVSKVKIEISDELTNKLLNNKQEYALYGIEIAG